MKHETIEIQAGLGVAVLWLNRPDVRNAFNEERCSVPAPI